MCIKIGPSVDKAAQRAQKAQQILERKELKDKRLRELMAQRGQALGRRSLLSSQAGGSGTFRSTGGTSSAGAGTRSTGTASMGGNRAGIGAGGN